VTTSIGTYTSISAGSITTGSATTTAGSNPNVTVQSSAAASGGSSSYTYQWRRTGTSSATLTGSAATYALSSDAANYSTAGTYRFNRYAKDATCNTSWVASANSYTLTVNMATPSGAASTKTWSFGSSTLVWSDRINISACNKTSFPISYTDPYCRSYTVDGVLRYYYNWAYVNQNAATLCPSGWRVPTKEDFDALVGATNYSTLINEWGYGGDVYDSSIYDPDTHGYYWSSTASGTNNAYYLDYLSGALLVTSYAKYDGRQVRCVKN
jgi:hypothetical protein